ncbi:glycosyltransferase family 2 protein [Aquimarina sp. MMG016]|uniref:glycosyltransferase family 2 protein n=1 Tax=Aquimarina sp. MMG016 TaxID=2822690 RepID=UPI001B3A798E|nr:glycosyltransferase family 2 protein [Aquimarina sp. MMG016]MBQ4822606.1 glycosyltransferase family 2 protein [Aquimarina sp. MMG016]
MELVSVVIGTYNGSEYIEDQLQSILNQTYSKIEVIIVDDASNDTTIDIVTEFSKKHKNIIIHAFDKNVGYIKNFERGIDLANGKYIALSDQDDWWAPTKIEKLINSISDYDLVYCNSTFVDEKLNCLGNSFSSTKNLINSNTPLNFLLDNCVSGHASLFTKSLYNNAKPFPELIPHDWWLAYVASLGNGLFYLDEPLVKYRHHQDNVIASNNKDKKDKKKNKKSKGQKFKERRHRINNFYDRCPDELQEEKRIILSVKESYSNFSLSNNLKRVAVLFSNRKEILKINKKNDLEKMFYLANMFFKIK